ncbi:MAG: SDR family oxidoreductase [Synergistaceae bacterium]|nr:SDR family oxidoreductase [Synergistaceae bacterium]
MNNIFSLDNKKILITGASSGIGRATAIMCSQMGAELIITGRNQERLAETFNALEGSNHEKICADISIQSEIDKLIDSSPQLDGLVNNAGILNLLPVDFITRDKLENFLNINTYAPITLFTGLIKKRKIKKGASVVFTSSLAGNFITAAGHALYSASKAAICGFAKNAALEMAARKIRVNCVCPGMIETNLIHDDKITPEMLANDMKRYPLKRYGKPEEVAAGIIYLLSDASSFTTGINLIIDGGLLLT